MRSRVLSIAVAGACLVAGFILGKTTPITPIQDGPGSSLKSAEAGPAERASDLGTVIVRVGDSEVTESITQPSVTIMRLGSGRAAVTSRGRHVFTGLEPGDWVIFRNASGVELDSLTHTFVQVTPGGTSDVLVPDK